MEIQQSPLYMQYIETLGWSWDRMDGAYIIYRHFPLMGGLAKMQRPRTLPHPSRFIRFLKQHKITRIAVEPDLSVDQKKFSAWYSRVGREISRNTDPFIPTKTIRVSLSGSEEDIFHRMSSAKRRAVRRALKNGIVIRESSDIDDLIRIKNKSAGLLGFITTHGIKHLWPIMAPDHTSIVLAYAPGGLGRPSRGNLVGGILLLFFDGIAYYWIAGATKKGKKLFAPTLLVWEAFRISRRRKCRWFDFVGVVDERLPDKYSAWKGFTKFKEGFGGKEVYYPIYSRDHTRR
ncbi:peptidoglycan bridge formation glycyltransferase FemA/FemB family protein [Patescibacteria group bacterium]|nr:peptidoglycan bridge formation glycyltransferase FemA/FemB family protein [Patescibacteria group bacterium]